MDFSQGNTGSFTFLTDLVPFPLDFPQHNVRYILDGFRAISHVFLMKT